MIMTRASGPEHSKPKAASEMCVTAASCACTSLVLLAPQCSVPRARIQQAVAACDSALRAVIATMKKPEDGIKMLKVAYTGEQRGVSDDDKDNGKAKKQHNGSADESHSSIRDHTGSGVERKVDGSTDMSDSMFQV